MTASAGATTTTWIPVPASSLKKQIVVRVTDDLLAALQADAAHNERTLAQTVRFHLRRALRSVS